MIILKTILTIMMNFSLIKFSKSFILSTKILFSTCKAAFLFRKDFTSISLSILNLFSGSSNLFPSINKELLFILKFFGLFKLRILFF